MQAKAHQALQLSAGYDHGTAVQMLELILHADMPDHLRRSLCKAINTKVMLTSGECKKKRNRYKAPFPYTT